MQEGIQDDDGQGGGNDDRRLDGDGDGGLVLAACGVAQHGRAVYNVAQEQHHRELGRVQVDQAVEPVVPEEHRRV